MKKMIVTDAELLSNLLFGPGQPLGGSRLGDEELVRLASETFSEKPFCVVRHWMLLDVMLPQSMEKDIKAQGTQATILYAQVMVFDSRGMHKPGGSVLSSYQLEFDGCVFESKDTIFILAGRGSRKHASLPAVQALAAY
jgi:hypothetical protein